MFDNAFSALNVEVGGMKLDSTCHGVGRSGLRIIVFCRGACMLQPKTPTNGAHSSGYALAKLESF